MADRKGPSEPRVEELLATIRRAIDQDINELDRRAQEGGQAPSRATPPARSQPQAPASAPARQPPRINPAEPPPAPLRGTFNEFREKYRPDADHDIARLRDRVKASRHDDPPPAPVRPPPDRSSAFSTILSQPNRAEPQFRPVSPPEPPPQAVEEVPRQGYETYEPYDSAQWEQPPEQQAYYPPAVQGYPEPEQPGLMSPDAAYAAHASFQALAQLALAQIGGDAGLQHMTRDVLNTLLREWLDRNLPPLVEALVREEIERVARGHR